MNNKLISTVTVLVLIIGGFLLFQNRSMVPTNREVNTVIPPESNNTSPETDNRETGTTVKEFEIEASTFYFSPSTITVNQGDTVGITVKSIGGGHDLKIDELAVSTRVLNTGEEQTTTFTADKVGTFVYYCSVDSHRALGMTGTLIVR